MKKLHIGTLIISIAIPLLIGGVSAALSNKAMVEYSSMNKPPLSPPSWTFSVVWTILYIIMGITIYLIIVADYNQDKVKVLQLFLLHLFMNFMWSIIFFNVKAYLFALIWLMVMTVIIIICAIRFYTIDKTATYLMIPYIIWLSFATYLNAGAYLLN